MSTCQADKANGEPCGANAMTGTDYCRHHQPSEKVAEVDGKQLDAAEEKAVGELLEQVKQGRSAGIRRAAADSILEYVRWQRGRDGE